MAVFGIPDDDLGEEVHAVVQLSDGVDAGPEDVEAELIAYCREQVAHLKCPRSIDFRDVLLATRPASSTSGCYERVLDRPHLHRLI